MAFILALAIAYCSAGFTYYAALIVGGFSDRPILDRVREIEPRVWFYIAMLSPFVIPYFTFIRVADFLDDQRGYHGRG